MKTTFLRWFFMKQKLTTAEISYAALSIALITVCSWLSIPLSIPFTFQTFAVCLVAALLGVRLGLVSVICYILLGMIGAPVFAGFRGGFDVLLGTTGGYIIGFLFTALTVGLAAERLGRKLPVLLISMAAGLLLCYAFGTTWFMVVYTRNSGTVGLVTALSWCVFPYLLPDTAKATLAALLTLRLYPILQKKRGSRHVDKKAASANPQ